MKAGLEEHYSKIRRILIWILVINWAGAAAKVIYGLLTQCASMTADGFHSFSDGASNIVGLIGISLACQPSDADHPYGHKKYETFFSLCIAGILGIICFHLIEEGIKRLYNPIIPRIDATSFILMLATLGINLLVANYEYKKGKALKSDILISDAMHTRADILTSLSVIITLVVIKLGFPILDAVATIIITVFIAKAAFGIVRQTSKVLCDTAVIVDLKKIEDIALSIEGVKTCHKIRTRGRPDDIYVDLHVQVSRTMQIDQAHKISSLIEEAIKKDIPEVSDVVVHMEPEDRGCSFKG